MCHCLEREATINYLYFLAALAVHFPFGMMTNSADTVFQSGSCFLHTCCVSHTAPEVPRECKKKKKKKHDIKSLKCCHIVKSGKRTQGKKWWLPTWGWGVERRGNFSRDGAPWWLKWSRVCLQCRRPGFRRSSGGGRGNSLQYSCLENLHRYEKPGGLQSMGSQRVRHDWVTNTFIFTLGWKNTFTKAEIQK